MKNRKAKRARRKVPPLVGRYVFKGNITGCAAMNDVLIVSTTDGVFKREGKSNRFRRVEMHGYLGPFLWPHKPGSRDEVGYEFLNARTEEYRLFWWRELIRRIKGG